MRMLQKPSTESDAQKGKTPRNASSPLRSSIEVYNGVPETIQRHSHKSFSQARAWSVVLLRISCISSSTTRSHLMRLRAILSSFSMAYVVTMMSALLASSWIRMRRWPSCPGHPPGQSRHSLTDWSLESVQRLCSLFSDVYLLTVSESPAAFSISHSHCETRCDGTTMRVPPSATALPKTSSMPKTSSRVGISNSSRTTCISASCSTASPAAPFPSAERRFRLRQATSPTATSASRSRMSVPFLTLVLLLSWGSMSIFSCLIIAGVTFVSRARLHLSAIVASVSLVTALPHSPSHTSPLSALSPRSICFFLPPLLVFPPSLFVPLPTTRPRPTGAPSLFLDERIRARISMVLPRPISSDRIPPLRPNGFSSRNSPSSGA
mmetsp:Transcript_35131/g.56746  ORF Transcript_35131/g.56746 Transcript_35131/m.56746 type:complete len:379 (-) Transcript_35131:1005-2141(-)